MRSRTFSRIAAAALLLVSLVAPLAADDAIAAGTYKGQWQGASGGGDIQMTFHTGATPEVSFTLSGQPVACKVLSFKADGAKFKIVYEFDAEGNALQSAVEGTVKGKSLEGTYKTTAGDQDVDSGTWKATAI
jgi:hypothetical protein